MKNSTIEAQLLHNVENAIDKAWNDGCPVASNAAEIAPIAIRRWHTSSRRRVAENNFEARINDLAKGLISNFEDNPKLVGPLKEDYRYLARVIANAIIDA